MIRVQEKQSTNLKDYSTRILIAGTKDCDNKDVFNDNMLRIVNEYDTDLIFITRAKCDLEEWVVEWCIENKYPYVISKDTKIETEDIRYSMVLASEMIIYNKKNEHPFNLYMTMAKRAKIDIATIVLGG